MDLVSCVYGSVRLGVLDPNPLPLQLAIMALSTGDSRLQRVFCESEKGRVAVKGRQKGVETVLWGHSATRQPRLMRRPGWGVR